MIKKCPPYNAGSEIYIVAFWRKKMSLIPNNAVVFSALKQGKKCNQIYPFFEHHFSTQNFSNFMSNKINLFNSKNKKF